MTFNKKLLHSLLSVQPDAGARSGVRFKGVAISRRNVPSFTFDDKFAKYITRAEALIEVNRQTADWREEACETIRWRPSVHIPRGKLDVWKAKPSGNYLPFQTDRRDKCLRGDLVLQLS